MARDMKTLAKILTSPGKRRAGKKKIARFLGVTHVSVIQWDTGKYRHTKGPSRTLAALAGNVGATQPDLVRLVASCEMPRTGGYDRMVRLIGTYATFRLLDVESATLEEWREMGREHRAVPRFALLLEVCDIFAPEHVDVIRANAAKELGQTTQ